MTAGVVGSDRRGWAHFGVAAGVLLAAAIGFNGAARALRVHLVKRPVPARPGAEIDGQQLRNFAKAFGPPVRVVSRGAERIVPRYQLLANLEVKEDMLDELGMTANPANWYYMSRYYDQGADRLVDLQVTYYTGLLDAVPHIPEICGIAGGGDLRESRETRVPLPGVAAPWDDLPVQRSVMGLRGGAGEAAQYYFFSMNGQPTASRETVRLNLTLPWVKYCYYAKVQVVVYRRSATDDLGPETDLAMSDQVVASFLAAAVPELLTVLPSADDVQQLEEADRPSVGR